MLLRHVECKTNSAGGHDRTLESFPARMMSPWNRDRLTSLPKQPHAAVPEAWFPALVLMTSATKFLFPLSIGVKSPDVSARLLRFKTQTNFLLAA